MLEADYFERKRRELGMDRQDDLTRVQSTLDKWYPGLARAKQLHLGVLRLVTASSSVASDLRMRQLELVAEAEVQATRVSITISTV